jgi:hypothetical protein
MYWRLSYLQDCIDPWPVIYQVLISLYWQDCIDPWLLYFIVYWCLCIGRTVSIRDLWFIMYSYICTGRTVSIRDYCNLSCIDFFVLAGLYRSVTFVIYHVLIALWRQDYVNPWLLKCILYWVFLYRQDYIHSWLL